MAASCGLHPTEDRGDASEEPLQLLGKAKSTFSYGA